MSEAIYFMPIGISKIVDNQSVELKNILIEKFGYSFEISKTEYMESYFEALIDAKVGGAKEFLDELSKYKSINSRIV